MLFVLYWDTGLCAGITFGLLCPTHVLERWAGEGLLYPRKVKSRKTQIFPIMIPEKVCAMCFFGCFACRMRVFNVWFENNTVLSTWFCISCWGRWGWGGVFFKINLQLLGKWKGWDNNFFSYEKTLELFIYTGQIWWWKICVTLKQRWSSSHHQPHWSG